MTLMAEKTCIFALYLSKIMASIFLYGITNNSGHIYQKIKNMAQDVRNLK